MLVVVGHGPSVRGSRLGSWIDRQTVVRLKHAERPTAQDWGTRTDYICASSPSFWTDKARNDPVDCEKWVLASKAVPRGPWWEASKGWYEVFKRFDPVGFPKPSTGLKAVFCAIERLGPSEIGLIGFDRILRPDVPTSKWFHEQGKFLYGHDAHAEHRCLMAMPIKVVDLGSVSGL